MTATHIFFVGPRKTGTSAFYDVLGNGDLSISKNIKETFFFDAPELDLTYYEPKFGINPGKSFIEISPSSSKRISFIEEKLIGHNRTVRELAKRYDREILEIDVTCEKSLENKIRGYLGVPLKNIPFPRSNRTIELSLTFLERL